MSSQHLHKIEILSEEVAFMNLNRLVSNSYMEGLIFKEMLEHQYVIKARELGKLEIVDDTDADAGFSKVIRIYAYFDDDALDTWTKYMFLEKLNGNKD